MSKPLDFKLVSPCGIYCHECNEYKNGCAGCGYVKGKPSWGECRFYPCVREKGIEHCGLCAEFPCNYYLSTFDPNEGWWRVFYRAGQLVYRKKIGTKAWLEEKVRGENPDPKLKK